VRVVGLALDKAFLTAAEGSVITFKDKERYTGVSLNCSIWNGATCVEQNITSRQNELLYMERCWLRWTKHDFKSNLIVPQIVRSSYRARSVV
jgi:hypothetical protein